MSVTIYDLAKAAGVSISTVSKALNDSYTISEETKQQIREMAEKMDYKPNARARSFARQHSGNVLFITDLYRNIAFCNPHMFEIVTGITKYLDEKNYSLLLKHVSAQDAPSGIKEMMIREQADAVIVHAAILTKQLAGVLTHANLPYLIIGKPPFPGNLCWMDVNHELAGRKAATYLLDKGYRRVIFMAGIHGEDWISESRFIGIQSAFQEEDLSVEVLWGESSYEMGINETQRVMRSQEPPEVILCTNNNIAIGCLHALNQMGLCIPKDVALMTFDNYPFSMIATPQITAVEADMYDLGQEAARFILRRIKKPELVTQSFCTVPRLLEREST